MKIEKMKNIKIVSILFPALIAVLLGLVITKTPFKYSAFILFCIILISLRNYFYRNFEFFLCILIIFNFQTFYLLPKTGEFYQYRVMLLAVLIAYLFVHYLRNRSFDYGSYGIWIIAYLVIVAIGLFTASRFGQPLLLGVKAVKYLLLVMIYFLVVNIRIDINKFTRYLVIMAIVIAILAIFQFIFINKFVIFNAFEANLIRMGEERGNRVLVGSSIISLAATIAFAKYLRGHGIFYLYSFIGLFLHVIIVVRTRMLMAGIVLTSIVLYLISRRFSIKTIFISFFVIIFLSVALSTQLAIMKKNKLVSQTVRQVAGQSRHSGMEVDGYRTMARFNAYNFYIGQIKKHPLLGRGFWNFNWTRNNEEWLQDMGIHFSDIGIVH